MIDVNEVVKDLDDRPMLDAMGPSDTPPTLTVGRVIANALFAQIPEERTLPWERRYARAALAMEVRNGKTEFTPEEIVEIKKCVGTVYNGIVLVRVMPLIDPTMEVPKIK